MTNTASQMDFINVDFRDVSVVRVFGSLGRVI